MRIGNWVSLGLVALQALACAAGRPSQLPGASEFPIRRVVLYQNGVGYFERAGQVDGNAITLQVRPSQINDLLKSLTVIDAGGGRVVSISLPLEQSGDRTLQELPPQVRQAGGLLDVLRLFRGARVELSGDYGVQLSGRVVGVENLREQAEQGEATNAADNWRVSLKTDQNQLQVVSLSDIRSVTLLDQTLSVGLDRSLDVSLGEGSWKPIALTIRLAGESPHQLVASYVVEMPRWKPAYRLVLEEGAQPLLQGWAVVDNVSGEDWRDVELSLVSGSPISFKYNLHTPQYAERVDRTPVGMPRAAAPPPSEQAGYVELAEEEAPMDDEFGDQSAVFSRRKSKAKRSSRSLASRGGAMRNAPLSKKTPSPNIGGLGLSGISGNALQAQGTATQGVSAGALFRYDIADPLSIADRSSTLVNIVNQRIEGQQVAYFRPELSRSSSEMHPYRAVKLVNGTELMLEKGPITVYSQGTFVGEGFVERMPQGATSFLTFAIDAKLTLNEQGGVREEEYRLLRIVNGQLLTEAQRVRTTTYEVKSRRKVPVRAYIRTLRESGWDLTEPPAETVNTPEARIVPLDVAPGASAKLVLTWKQAIHRTISIDSGHATELLRVYLGGDNVPAALAKTLRAVLKLKEQLGDVEKTRQRFEQQHRDLSRDQARVRENLRVLRKTKGNAALQRKLSRKLANQEDALGKLSGQMVQLSEQVAELEAQLKRHMAKASL